MRDNDDLLTAIVVLVAGGISIPTILAVLAVLRGWVLSKLWFWFIVPTFKVTELSVVQAIGLSVVVAMLAGNHYRYKSNDQGEKADAFINLGIAFIAPIFSLVVGYFVKMFM